MRARPLAYLDNERAVERLGLGLDLPPDHMVAWLRSIYWHWARHGHQLPARRGIVCIHGSRL